MDHCFPVGLDLDCQTMPKVTPCQVQETPSSSSISSASSNLET